MHSLAFLELGRGREPSAVPHASRTAPAPLADPVWAVGGALAAALWHAPMQATPG